MLFRSTLGGAGGLRTVSGANVDFATTVAGAGNSLTVDSPGTTTFGGAVSGVNALVTDAAGNTAINANITTVGTQIYNDAVTTASGVALTGGTITFDGRLSPAGDSAPGALTINGNLAFGPASTLFVNLNGTAAGTFDQITVNSGNVTINSGAALSGQAGFAYSVGDVVTVIKNTPATAVSGTFSPAPAVAVSGQTFGYDYVNGGANNVNLVRESTMWTWNGGGANDNWTTPANWTVDLNYPGTGDSVIFAGSVRLTPNNDNIAGLQLNQISFGPTAGAFTLGGNALSLSGGIVNNSLNKQTINMPLTLAGNQSFNAALGQLVFGGTINGGHTLTLNGANTITLGAAVGGVAPLAGLVANTSVALNNDVTTSGDQAYNGAVTLGGAGALRTLTGANVDLAGTVAGSGKSLTVNSPGTTTFGNTVSGVNALVTDAPGDTMVNGTVSASSVALNDAASLNKDVTTTGNQDYNGAVTLGGAGVRLLNGGTVTFGSTVALNNDVSSSGTLDFNGAVMLGGVGGLRTVTGANVDFASTVAGVGNSLTVNSPGTTTFGGAVSGINALVTDAPGNTSINAVITTAGDQTYGDAVALGADTVLTGATPTFGSTVTGNGHDLSLDFSGPTLIDGAKFTGIRNLESGNGGVTTLQGTVTTSGDQTYNDAVTLGADATITGVNETLVGVSGGNNSLTLNNSGVATLNGTVSGVKQLNATGAGTLVVNNTVSGNLVNDQEVTALNGTGGAETITTAAGNGQDGSQTYTMAVTLGADTTLNGVNETLAGVSGGNHSLTLNNSGAAKLNGAVNNVGALVVNGSGTLAVHGTISAGSVNDNEVTTLSGGTVTTSRSQTYGRSVTLGSDNTLSGSSVTFGSTVDGAHGLIVNGQTTLGGPVGNSTALSSLRVNGTAVLNGGRVTTSGGGQTYDEAVTLGTQNVLADSGSGTIRFNSTIDGPFALQVNSLGDEVFNGAVGRATPLASLTTDGAGSVGGHAYLNVPGTQSSPSVKTTGAQIYNDNLVLEADAVLVGSSIIFGSGVSANGHNLGLQVVPQAGPQSGPQFFPNVQFIAEDNDRRILETIMPQLRPQVKKKVEFKGVVKNEEGEIATRSFDVPRADEAKQPVDDQIINP